jgi:HEAT repeat protein
LGILIPLLLGSGLYLHWKAGSFQPAPETEHAGSGITPALDRSVNQLMHDLQDPRVEVRRKAAASLANAGPEAEKASAELIAALKDKDQLVQAHAVEALTRLGPNIGAHALLPLIDGLRDDDPAVGRKAIIVLVAMGKKAVPALKRALERENTLVSEGALTALVQLGPDAVQPLVDMLASRNATVRQRAALGLEHIGPKAAAAVSALGKALKDRNPGVRRRAAAALGAVGPEARPAVPALETALRDSDPGVRKEAAAALHRIGLGVD